MPTRLRTIKFNSNTYQYAVTQHTKKTESHQAGIFIKYDFAGLGVEVVESREKITSLFTRLCGILGRGMETLPFFVSNYFKSVKNYSRGFSQVTLI